MSRPELQAPPDLFYNKEEAQKYASNTRMLKIQARMTHRAVQLLNLPAGKRCHILDIGCGSGLSGEVLSELGHSWVGLDIAPAMLGVAVEREVEGDLLCHDMGQGLPFRPGVFDAAVSISAVQWLCNAETKRQKPHKRLLRFFDSLYRCLQRGGRAVLQIYPQGPDQLRLITQQAMRAGFTGAVQIDNPNAKKARKYYLVLTAGDPRSTTAYLPTTQTSGLSGGSSGTFRINAFDVSGGSSGSSAKDGTASMQDEGEGDHATVPRKIESKLQAVNSLFDTENTFRFDYKGAAAFSPGKRTTKPADSDEESGDGEGKEADGVVEKLDPRLAQLHGGVRDGERYGAASVVGSARFAPPSAGGSAAERQTVDGYVMDEVSHKPRKGSYRKTLIKNRSDAEAWATKTARQRRRILRSGQVKEKGMLRMAALRRKKRRQVEQGRKIKRDSRYTGRRRKGAF